MQSCWYDMIQRCSNSKLKSWKAYGGRGITVCERWRDQTEIRIYIKGKPSKKGFKNFLDDMESTWFPGATIDRIDNDGDYTPENCQWLSKSENRKKVIFTDERKESISNHLKGIPKTQEMKNKLSIKMKGNDNGKFTRNSLTVYDIHEKCFRRISIEEYRTNRKIRYLNLQSHQYKEMINVDN